MKWETKKPKSCFEPRARPLVRQSFQKLCDRLWENRGRRMTKKGASRKSRRGKRWKKSCSFSSLSFVWCADVRFPRADKSAPNVKEISKKERPKTKEEVLSRRRKEESFTSEERTFNQLSLVFSSRNSKIKGVGARFVFFREKRKSGRKTDAFSIFVRKWNQITDKEAFVNKKTKKFKKTAWLSQAVCDIITEHIMQNFALWPFISMGMIAFMRKKVNRFLWISVPESTAYAAFGKYKMWSES